MKDLTKYLDSRVYIILLTTPLTYFIGTRGGEIPFCGKEKTSSLIEGIEGTPTADAVKTNDDVISVIFDNRVIRIKLTNILLKKKRRNKEERAILQV